MSIKRQVKQRDPITTKQVCQRLSKLEGLCLADFQELRQFVDTHHLPATVVPNLVSAARSLKVTLDHVRAALSIAEDLD